MKFRSIDFTRLLYNLGRYNYMLTNYESPNPGNLLYRTRLGSYFRWLWAIVTELDESWEVYEGERAERYMVASCAPINGQASNVLNYIFGANGTHGSFGNITISTETGGIFFPYIDSDAPEKADQVFLPYDDSAPESSYVYFPWEGIVSNHLVIRIPSSLEQNEIEFDNFIAYVNAIFPYSIRFVIETY